MTDSEAAVVRFILKGDDAWLPLALLAPDWLDACETLVTENRAVLWPNSPDGPAVTLTPLEAGRLAVELREYAETRVVTCEPRAGAWWAADRPKPKAAKRKVAVPQWYDAGDQPPPGKRKRRWGAVRSWFPERIDPRPGPAELAEAREPRFIMGVEVQPLRGRKVPSKKARRVRRAG